LETSTEAAEFFLKNYCLSMTIILLLEDCQIWLGTLNGKIKISDNLHRPGHDVTSQNHIQTQHQNSIENATDIIVQIDKTETISS
jgi:hypothetical protein